MEQKKIAFLDRDGVINKKASEHSYITSIEEFIFNEDIFEVCLCLQSQGFECVVVTNQRGIARGLYTEADLASIHAYMEKKFLEKGIAILRVYYCPHEIGKCGCRKPLPGMLNEAVADFPIDLERSILISDSKEDIDMGKSFGIGRQILIDTDSTGDVLRQL